VLVFGSNFVRAGCGGLVRLCGWSAWAPRLGWVFRHGLRLVFAAIDWVVVVGCGVGELN
jgi:hypothetical protein